MSFLHTRKAVASLLIVFGSMAAVFVSAVTVQAQSEWLGSWYWSVDGNPGWNGTGIPNGQGAIAQLTVPIPIGPINNVPYLGQDIAGTVTVGSIRFGNNNDMGNVYWWIDNINGNTITLDQDGVGASPATISNSSTNATGNNALYFTGSAIILNDDLQVLNNAGGSTNSNGSVQFTTPLTGSGNITFVGNGALTSTNTVSHGATWLSGANSYVGSSLVRSGLVVVNATATAFGDLSNTVTLGQSGSGSAGILSREAASTLNYNLIVAPSAIGETRVFGASSNSSFTVSNSSIMLNGDLSLRAGNTSTTAVQSYTGNISGVGGITKIGTAIVSLQGVNTYTGQTRVTENTLHISAPQALYNDQAAATWDAAHIVVDAGKILAISLGTGFDDTRISTLAGLGTGSGGFANGAILALDTALSGDTTVAADVTNSNAIYLGKSGAGKLTYTGNNTSTGGFAVFAGTLQLGDGGSTGTMNPNGNVINAGSFIVNRSDAVAINGVISGAGTLTHIGTGTTTLSGANSYTGATTILGGTIETTSLTALGTGAVVFGDGTTAATGTLNVAQSLTVGSLAVRNNDPSGIIASNINISAGKTMTVTGAVTVGNTGIDGQNTKLVVAGPGTFAINTGSNVNFGQYGAGSTTTASVDLTSVGAFNLTSAGFNAGGVTGVNTRPAATTVLLSNTANNIVTTTMIMSYSGTANGSSTTLTLGTGTNSFNVNSLTIGTQKSGGIMNFASSTPGSPGTVSIAGRTIAKADIILGDWRTGSSGNSATVDLRGHRALINAGTLQLARVAGGTVGTGSFSFDTGYVSVDTLDIAPKSTTTAATATGTVNIGGGIFNVNNTLTMGTRASSGTSVANLNITGGTLITNATIAEGGGTTNVVSSLNLDGGTLNMAGNNIGVGTAGAEIGTSTTVGTQAPLVFKSGTLRNVGLINGTAGVTKTTAGTLTVDGAVGYTGATAVNAGTLRLKPTNSPTIGSIIVATGAQKLIIAPTTTATTITSGAVTTNTGGNSIDFELVGTPASAAAAPLKPSAFNSAAGTTIGVSTTAPLAIGKAPLINYGAGTIGGGGFIALSLTGLPPRTTATLIDDATDPLNKFVGLDVTAFDTIRWNGGTADWDISPTNNWALVAGLTPTNYQQAPVGDLVTFNDLATSNYNVNVAAAVAPTSITFANATNPYTLGGVNSANTVTTQAVTINGSNTVNLSTAGTFSAGTFTVASTSSSNVNISAPFSANTFTHNGTGIVTLSGSAALSLPSSLTLGTGSTLTYNRSADEILSSALTGAGSFRKEGTNTLSLAGNSFTANSFYNYSGAVTVASGTLKLLNNNSLGSNIGGTTVLSGATLDLNSMVLAGETVSMEGTGAGGVGALYNSHTSGNVGFVPNVILTGNTKIGGVGGYEFGGTTGSFTFQGNGFALTQEAATAQIEYLSVGDMNVGSFDLKGGGIAYFAGDSTLGSAAGPVTIYDNSLLGFYASLNAGQYPSTGATDGKAVVIDATGGTIAAYRGVKQFDASTITLNGNLEFLTYPRDDNTSATLTVTGKLTGPGNLSVHREGNATTTRKGLVELISDLNDYAGTTTIGGGGGKSGETAAQDFITLSIGNGNASGSIGPGNVIVTNPGILQFNRNNAMTVANQISGTGNVNQVGAGTTTLTGANTYSGRTSVINGGLNVTGSHAGAGTYTVDNGSSITLASTATIQTQGAFYVGSNSIGSAENEGSLTITGTAGGAYDTTGQWGLGVGVFPGGNGVFVNKGSGSVDSKFDLRVGDGFGAAANGLFRQESTGAVTASNQFTVGNAGGTGEFIKDSGSGNVNIGSEAYIGTYGGQGTFTQKSGNVNIDFRAYFGFGGGQGTFTHESGNVTIGIAGLEDYHLYQELYLGMGDANSHGEYDLQAGTLTVNGWANIGRDAGTGEFNNAGTFNITRELRVGLGGSASGELNNLAGGTIEVGQWITVGNDATGVLNQSGGTIETEYWLTMGESNGSTGTYNVSGPSTGVGATTLTTQANMELGYLGNGYVNQNGGALDIGEAVILGNQPSATGHYVMDAGSLKTGGWLTIGREGLGEMTVDGAGTTINVGDNLAIGQFSNSANSLTINDGTVTVEGNRPAYTGNVLVGDHGNGTLTMTGGTLDMTTGNTGTNHSASYSISQAGGDPELALAVAQDGNLSIAEEEGIGVADIGGDAMVNVAANVFVGGANFDSFLGGNGTLTISGTAEMHVGVTSPTGGDLVLGTPLGSTSVVNLQGGLLNVAHSAGGFGGNIGAGGAGSTITFNFTGGTLKTKVWNAPNALFGGDLGDLVQNGALSLLDVTGNDTSLAQSSDYDLVAGAATIGGGHTLTAANVTNDIAGAGTINVGDGPSNPDGDYNLNGTVDAADFVLWRKTPGLFGGPGGYTTWRQHFGETGGVGPSGTLDVGAGTVDVDAVVFNNGKIIAANTIVGSVSGGALTGTGEVAGNLSLASGSTTTINLNSDSDFDKITVSGGGTLNYGLSSLQINLNYTPGNPSQTWDIFEFGLGLFANNFSSIETGWLFAPSTGTLTWNGGSGSSLDGGAVPEPTTLALVALAAFGGLVRRPRRQIG